MKYSDNNTYSFIFTPVYIFKAMCLDTGITLLFCLLKLRTEDLTVPNFVVTESIYQLFIHHSHTLWILRDTMKRRFHCVCTL
jgi:hypothetical protein